MPKSLTLESRVTIVTRTLLIYRDVCYHDYQRYMAVPVDSDVFIMTTWIDVTLTTYTVSVPQTDEFGELLLCF